MVVSDLSLPLFLILFEVPWLQCYASVGFLSPLRALALVGLVSAGSYLWKVQQQLRMNGWW